MITTKIYRCIAGVIALLPFFISACNGLNDDHTNMTYETVLNRSSLYSVKPGSNEPFEYGAGVFSWNSLPGVWDIKCMTQNQITEIYQFIGPDYTDEIVCDFLSDMSEADIDVYYLDGEPGWTKEENYAEMAGTLKKVRHFNSLVDEGKGFKGIVFDVEAYAEAEWDRLSDQLLKEYCNNLKRIKEDIESDTSGIDVCVCIPFAYDKTGHEVMLRHIIQESDQVFVMNYAKGTEIENLEREALLAKRLNKRLVNIYELQPENEPLITESNSYYKNGLKAVNDNYMKLLEAYPGHEIGIAYHTLDYLRELSDGK